MQTAIKKINQIKALSIRLNSGQVKNPYAIKNKIEKLKKEIESINRGKAWTNFLAK
jgi:hypothetical protein